MTRECTFANGLVVLRDRVVRGGVHCVRDRISDVSGGLFGAGGPDCVDLDGDYLLPGLVELHTDHLESHLMPRPGVVWPHGLAALVSHDAQIAGAGITTVLDSTCVGEPMNGSHRAQLLALTVEALQRALPGNGTDVLKADHRLHLRCEISDPMMPAMLKEHLDNPLLRLVSIMDHSPGQRQWRDMAKFRQYHSRRSWNDQQFEDVVRERTELHDRHSARNRATALEWCAPLGVSMASHDDTEPEHVDEAVRAGISISEFPTTIRAARRARERGMTIVVGAPNVVRGESHSGNVSALELAREGLLDVLSSDYLPISLLSGAFALVGQADMDLSDAVACVTANPAQAAGFADRGEIEPGRRADLVRVRMVDGVPVVRGVWREGRRVA